MRRPSVQWVDACVGGGVTPPRGIACGGRYSAGTKAGIEHEPSPAPATSVIVEVIKATRAGTDHKSCPAPATMVVGTNMTHMTTRHESSPAAVTVAIAGTKTPAIFEES